MGNRFLRERYRLDRYSRHRQFLRLNERDYEPHRMRAYGIGGGEFTYYQRDARQRRGTAGNRRGDRAAKKAVRRQGKARLREELLV